MSRHAALFFIMGAIAERKHLTGKRKFNGIFPMVQRCRESDPLFALVRETRGLVIRDYGLQNYSMARRVVSSICRVFLFEGCGNSAALNLSG